MLGGILPPGFNFKLFFQPPKENHKFCWFNLELKVRAHMKEHQSDMKTASAAWMISSERAALAAGKLGIQI